MSEFTLKYEDYNKEPGDGLNEEITDANKQQEARQEDATLTDWETRYKELEKLNSRQAQTLGEYRRTIDEFIIDPTSTNTDEPKNEELQLTSADDFYSDPNAAVLRAVDSHPAIREAKELQTKLENEARERALEGFSEKHPDYKEIVPSPEFLNWAYENPTRRDLAVRADKYDLNAADALLSLWKAEKGLSQAKSERELQQVELISSSGELVQDPPKYSRSEYINKLMRAKQGDLEAETWVKNNAAKYRNALQSGNVRD